MAALAPPVRLATRRAQPTVVFILRLTLTATAAYLIATWLPGAEVPLLAPLTALLVVQVTLYKTIRAAFQRIASVVAGVMIAVWVASVLGFTWWSLGATIAAALVVGYVFRLGDQILEVPISAMLILALGAHTTTGATGRAFETLIGAATGLLAGVIASPVHMRPAREAVGDLADRMSEMVDRMAGGMTGESGRESMSRWTADTREVTKDIQRVGRELDHAEESLRLNPRAPVYELTTLGLRGGLEALEYSALTLRGLARSMADRAAQPPDESLTYDEDSRKHLAAALREIAGAMRAYGKLVQDQGNETLRNSLRRHLSSGRHQRDGFAHLLTPDASPLSARWRLHAEVLVHLDRLLDLFHTEHQIHPSERRRGPSIADRRRARRAAARAVAVEVMRPRTAWRPRDTRRPR
ncbi:FUSC family protein [Sinosporangium siamense]|uniref:FUSC family protein n=2 Tax=Sinosporangium siamense TaxID=1367973 RepID=A0A919V431_9ACTN|nr:FUSC family protein [Sinosporangium siamense]